MSRNTLNKLQDIASELQKRRQDKQARRDFIKSLNNIDEIEIAF